MGHLGESVMTAVVQSILIVRRSIHIKASPTRVWDEFTTFERMNRWWGVLIGEPNAGTGQGQRLVKYEPRQGGWIEMEVIFGNEPVRYGGKIIVFEPGHEMTYESDWFPNRGWLKPTLITLRLTAALGGTYVELLHHGFENAGAADDHAGYEGGWSMTQLNALKQIIEGR